MAVGNMSKIAINNEIVLMRQAVRQSRVVVVRKLIKEAKLLQARKHGDEKVKEKCKRKAQRLVAEIAAIKKLKDDEISKFGIANTNTKLQDVLSATSAEPATRVMSRVAFHKILSDRINKFKEKFPDYEQYLGPGRKKLSKIQRQANREARNALRRSVVPGEANPAISQITDETENVIVHDGVKEESENNSNEEDENNEDPEGEIEPVADIEIEENASKEMDDSIAAEHGLEPGSILRIKTPSSAMKKRKVEDDPSEIEAVDCPSDSSKKRKSNKRVTNVESKTPVKASSLAAEPSEKPEANPEQKENKKNVVKPPAEPKKQKTIKVISKEASVKRFTELMDDGEPEECIETPDISSSSKKLEVKIEKEIDSFFMTENGESEYLSVVVPRPKPCEDAEEDERFSQNHAAKRQKNFHERNNKFFSKIDQRANGVGHGNKFAGHAGGRHKQQNDFANGPPEKFGRNFNGPARQPRNGKPEFEKKSEPKVEELHPSWAARKKQQEILKQGFQGKKIVFDD